VGVQRGAHYAQNKLNQAIAAPNSGQRQTQRIIDDRANLKPEDSKGGHRLVSFAKTLSGSQTVDLSADPHTIRAR
jgi:hypothetical protein